MEGKIARIQVLWIDNKNPNKVVAYLGTLLTRFKFFLSVRFQAGNDKIDIRGYRKNTQYSQLCELMLKREICTIPVKLYKDKYFFE